MLFSLFQHYLVLHITDNALKVSQSFYCFTTSVSHGVENSSPGGGVRASLMLFYLIVYPCFSTFNSVAYNCCVFSRFSAPNEGAIAMREGQEFQVVEQDQGDGWTRVRNSSGEEGFVPTSYVEVHLD